MKKLFFSVAVAIVAIGGAFASSSKKVVEPGEFYSETAQNPDIQCTVGELLCSAFYSQDAYDKPASDGSRVIVDLSEYEHN